MSKKGIVIREDILNRLRKIQEELTKEKGEPVSLEDVLTCLMDSFEREKILTAQKEYSGVIAEGRTNKLQNKGLRTLTEEKRGIPTEKSEIDVRGKEEHEKPEIAVAIYRIADILGERIRNSCKRYDDKRGICTWYELYDIPDDFRESFPDIFSDIDGKTRFFVGNNPWICALCRKGRI